MICYGVERAQLLELVGALELRAGDNEEAIEELTGAYKLMEGLSESYPRLWRRITYQLAIAHMRFGETQNCVSQHTSQSCILPIGESGVHVDQQEVQYPIVSAPEAGGKYGITAYPTYYLVSAKGEVLAGPQHGKFSDGQIEKALKDVMLLPDVPNKGPFKAIKKQWKKRKFVEIVLPHRES